MDRNVCQRQSNDSLVARKHHGNLGRIIDHY